VNDKSNLKHDEMFRRLAEMTEIHLPIIAIPPTDNPVATAPSPRSYTARLRFLPKANSKMSSLGRLSKWFIAISGATLILCSGHRRIAAPWKSPRQPYHNHRSITVARDGSTATTTRSL